MKSKKATKEKSNSTGNTRTRILATSLQLFNDEGECNVSTNHIAATLGISPGNLYYHFRNKADIIYELFIQYEEEAMSHLSAPEDRLLTFDDKIRYFESIFQILWDYRFIYRDLVHVLRENPALKLRYGQFTKRSLARVRRIYQRLVESDILIAQGDQIDALIVNTWVIISSWASFLYSSLPNLEENAISQDLIQRGVYQIVCLEAPYLTEKAKAQLPKLMEIYKPYEGYKPTDEFVSLMGIES